MFRSIEIGHRIPNLEQMRSIALIILLYLFTLSSNCFGQTKYEREVRIKAALVPSNAIQFIKDLSHHGKVKWYKEYGLQSTSYEGKFRSHARRYSVEFSDEGTFEDVEIKVKWASVPEEVKTRMIQYKESVYVKFSIQKVQRQYVGDQQAVIDLLNHKEPHSTVTVNYEVVVAAKKDRSYMMYELLFSSEGELIRESRVVSSNTDNLEY